MVYCCVPFCKSDKKVHASRGVTFHEFPVSNIRRKWIKVISRQGTDEEPWGPSDRTVVCSLHFRESDFRQGLKIRRLNPDAVPSNFPDYPPDLQRRILRWSGVVANSVDNAASALPLLAPTPVSQLPANGCSISADSSATPVQEQAASPDDQDTHRLPHRSARLRRRKTLEAPPNVSDNASCPRQQTSKQPRTSGKSVDNAALCLPVVVSTPLSPSEHSTSNISGETFTPPVHKVNVQPHKKVLHEKSFHSVSCQTALTKTKVQTILAQLQTLKRKCRKLTNEKQSLVEQVNSLKKQLLEPKAAS